MKTTLFITAALSGCLIAGEGCTQDAVSGNTLSLTEIEPLTLAGFYAIVNEGQTFLQWKVCGEKEDGLFIVERSRNGVSYNVIHLKPGIGVPHPVTLLYCATDSTPAVDTNFYRLTKVYADGRYYRSGVVKILAPENSSSASGSSQGNYSLLREMPCEVPLQ